jgi:hypothetical protein
MMAIDHACLQILPSRVVLRHIECVCKPELADPADPYSCVVLSAHW